MNKQVIFKPRKSFASAAKNVRLTIKDLGLDAATEIGLEILKIDDVFYTVKNVYSPTQFDVILSTDDADERYTASQVAKVGA